MSAYTDDKREKEHTKRLFLEPRGHADSYAKLHIDMWHDATLKLADCHRSVELYFYAQERQQARASLRKLARLQGVIDELKAHLEARVKEAK